MKSMDIRDEENDFRDKNLSFKYKSLTEEEKFIDNVILENNSSKENNTKELKPKITKEDIMKAVMEQVNYAKRDDKTQEHIEEHSDENLNINKWFDEFQKQPILVNKERLQAYLECYEDLEKLIKFREDKLVSGEAKPESKTLEINKIQNFDFLDKSNINTGDFFSKIDYKLREMKFYHRNLCFLLKTLKTYGFLVYQYIAFKYFLKLDKKDIEKLTPFKNLDYLDSLTINYLTNKLVEEARKECQY